MATAVDLDRDEGLTIGERPLSPGRPKPTPREAEVVVAEGALAAVRAVCRELVVPISEVQTYDGTGISCQRVLTSGVLEICEDSLESSKNC